MDTGGLPQHADPHRPEDVVLLAVDQGARANDRLCAGSSRNSPIRSARSKSGRRRTWRSSARGAGPRPRGACGGPSRSRRRSQIGPTSTVHQLPPARTAPRPLGAIKHPGRLPTSTGGRWFGPVNGDHGDVRIAIRVSRWANEATARSCVSPSHPQLMTPRPEPHEVTVELDARCSPL